ncbi:MAG TPA: hypothetical protein VGP33_00915 [Chloroflexota bacterium]|nr:hypothetical protein [Chloroflexota bacterium]
MAMPPRPALLGHAPGANEFAILTGMKRTTTSLPEHLLNELEQFRQDQAAESR